MANAFTYIHTLYWYVGEIANAATTQEYASDFAQGWINGHAGILGVSQDFFTHHFGQNSLNHIRLMLLISSDGNAITPQLITAGISTVVFCNGFISLQFGLIDDLTSALVT